MTGSFHVAERGAADGNLPKVSSGLDLAELGIFASSRELCLTTYKKPEDRNTHVDGLFEDKSML